MLNKIKPKQFLRVLQWEFLSSPILSSQPLPGAFFTSAIVEYLLTSAVELSCLISAQGSPKNEPLLSNFPLTHPPNLTNSQTQHIVISVSSATLNIVITLCNSDAPTLLFSSETLAFIFTVWNSSSIWKHFSLKNHLLVRGNK